MSKERYDRQIRLWATSGQSSLENGHVCVINALVLASEMLKNLVLPGIGDFTIIDPNPVTEADVSCGFFLEREDLGSSIAESMVLRLQDLNPDVKGHSLTLQNWDSGLLDLDWTQFSMVAVTQPYKIDYLSELQELLWELNIPLIIADTMGFYGYLHSLYKEVSVVETHPESLIDLRIDQPWPQLVEYVASVDLDALDDTDHAHIPFVVILVKALGKWRNTHGPGSIPQLYDEKKQFKEIVSTLSRNLSNENNFQEAVANSWRACQKTEIPVHIEELLHDTAANVSLHAPKNAFWIYINALKNFVANGDHTLPLSGVLPDMASDTKNYVLLQNIYRKKALEDQEVLANEIERIQNEIGSNHVFDDESIKTFCKSCRYLHVARGTGCLYPRSNNELSVIYSSMVAFGKFLALQNTTPTLAEQLLGDSNISDAQRNIANEIIAHNTPYYHNTCSFMGGIAAQEALKLVTKQYRPLDNVFVYDGVHSVTEKWKA